MKKNLCTLLFSLVALLAGCGEDGTPHAAANPVQDDLSAQSSSSPEKIPAEQLSYGVLPEDLPSSSSILDLPVSSENPFLQFSSSSLTWSSSSLLLRSSSSRKNNLLSSSSVSQWSSSSKNLESSSSSEWVSSSSEQQSSSSVKLTLEQEVAMDRQYVAAGSYSEFQSVSNVLNQVQSNQKLILVLRHAERGDDFSKWGQLTQNGIQQSRELGRKLKNGVPAFYGHSPFLRTKDTGRYIAMERGDIAEGAELQNSVELESLGDDWYVKDMGQHEQDKNQMGGGWQLFSKWAFEGGYEQGMYDMASRSVELITQQLIPSIPAEYSMGIFISHDKVLVPLVAYCTDRKVDLRYWQNGRWTENLQGIAIIVNEDGSRKYIPVDGLR